MLFKMAYYSRTVPPMSEGELQDCGRIEDSECRYLVPSRNAQPTNVEAREDSGRGVDVFDEEHRTVAGGGVAENLLLVYKPPVSAVRR